MNFGERLRKRKPVCAETLSPRGPRNQRLNLWVIPIPIFGGGFWDTGGYDVHGELIPAHQLGGCAAIKSIAPAFYHQPWCSCHLFVAGIFSSVAHYLGYLFCICWLSNLDSISPRKPVASTERYPGSTYRRPVGCCSRIPSFVGLGGKPNYPTVRRSQCQKLGSCPCRWD